MRDRTGLASWGPLIAIMIVGAAYSLEPDVSWANQQSATLTLRAFELAHNLDQDEALATARRAVEADDEDPAAHRAVAAVVWLKILYQRGVVTFDDYMGPMAAPNLQIKAPPPDLAGAFELSIARALSLAERRLKTFPRDADAHYQVGATVGLLGSYRGTVQGQVVGAFRAARRAFDENEQVLQLDPRRRDAALVVGAYRYGISNLSLPLRLMAYVAGFGGGREQGIRLIEEAATYRDNVHTDPLFALMVIYNRERRYADAARVIRELQQHYPRNRLLWLNAGATALAAGRAAAAEVALNEGLAKCERDRRPRAFGEDAVWKYKRGAARLALGNVTGAEADLRAALAAEGRDWVRGRAHAESGKLADLAGDHVRARREYETAIKLAQADNDPVGLIDAKHLLRSGYRATPATSR